jgi:acetyl esterase/lipase
MIARSVTAASRRARPGSAGFGPLLRRAAVASSAGGPNAEGGRGTAPGPRPSTRAARGRVGAWRSAAALPALAAALLAPAAAAAMLTSAAAAAMLTSAAAAAILASAAPVAAQTMVDGLPAPRVTLGDVTVATDLVYARPPGFRPLRLDVYAAAGDAPRPLVVFVHGAGEGGGDKRVAGMFEPFPETFADLARAGFVVASVEYRQAAEAGYPAAVDDVAAALAWLRAEENRFGIDPRRIALWGVGAGAHLAAAVGFGCGGEGRGGCVRAVVGWSGAYDRVAEAGPEGPFAVLACGAGCAASAPIALAGPGDPATLLVHGEVDAAAPLAQATALAERLAAAGVPVETVTLPGVGQGWSAPSHGASGLAARRALAETVAFLAMRLRAGP